MLHELFDVTCNKFYLIYKDKEEVKERVIYFFHTDNNIANIIKYAKSEGADYVCYRYNGPLYEFYDDFIPVLSTDGLDCVAIIKKDDFSLDNLKESVMNAIEHEKETHRALRHRYHLSPVKSIRIIEEMAQYCGNSTKKKIFQTALKIAKENDTNQKQS